MVYLKRYSRNTRGRDIAVGDIHGHFTILMRELKRIGFDASKDRLFPVGDLGDRGPESYLAGEWLRQDWFCPVMGNHDSYIARYRTESTGKWMKTTGLWFAELHWEEQDILHDLYVEIPHMVEVETANGTVGIVHGSFSYADWNDTVGKLKSRIVRNHVMYSRERIKHGDTTPVKGIHAVICGHEPVKEVTVLGNVYHIETSGHRPDTGGKFTLLDLETLQPL